MLKWTLLLTFAFLYICRENKLKNKWFSDIFQTRQASSTFPQTSCLISANFWRLLNVLFPLLNYKVRIALSSYLNYVYLYTSVNKYSNIFIVFAAPLLCYLKLRHKMSVKLKQQWSLVQWSTYTLCKHYEPFICFLKSSKSTVYIMDKRNE